ncbi:hypothetical protein [Leifsonia sp. Leaf264]|uniref:hypothetical protein n=1 Tax=Leifsonia sp. Leaf264 TaxID=1736314 RepID=UPI0006F50F2D|nr:hypothetical protein [Leifsonia sp. Leaf264]KQO98567.1 hypothetical protein ASF30_10930 [Leifsonia sp. Leaf264]
MTAQTPTTEQLAERLDWLANARTEYLSPELRKIIAADENYSHWAQSEADKTLLGEISGMKSAARALRGADMLGWLPSWRWDDWEPINDGAARVPARSS